jgi:Ser/Thr protein kinase RdoA (MazF antagonist)
MTPHVWTKHYRSAARAQLAVANYRWLDSRGLSVPALSTARDNNVTWERIDGRHPGSSEDILHVAATLGAWHRRLADVDLRDSAALPEFMPSRALAIRRSAAPGAALSAADVPRLRAAATRCSPSIYKDLNVRNVLLDGDRVMHVDFDDLTLAPAGYDLAKLVVTYAMSHGVRPSAEQALAAYNKAAGAELCAATEFVLWMELHHIMTSRYLTDGHYTYSWPSLRSNSDMVLLERWREGPF